MITCHMGKCAPAQTQTMLKLDLFGPDIGLGGSKVLLVGLGRGLVDTDGDAHTHI